MEIAQWIDDEFALADIGDSRLDRRLKMCVCQFSRMRESTPGRCQSKADLKATYRFVDNPKVHMSSVFKEHNRASRARCLEKNRVYLLQDTTEVELTKPNQQVMGAGPLGTDKRRGFFYHPLYAMGQDGIPLGVVDQMVWARSDESLKVSTKQREAERRRACFEEKESSRWMEMLQSGEQLARSQGDTEFIMVADSEADLSELFCEAEQFPANYHLVIRGWRQRRITSAVDLQNGESIQADSVESALDQATVRFCRTVQPQTRPAPTLPDDKQRTRKQARSAREATLNIRTIEVTIEGPRRRGGGHLPDAKINVVELLEANPPAGEDPIHWVLYTDLPTQTVEQIDDIIDFYCQRWAIELFFKTLKSGMKIEDMKYETLDRYQVAFAMLVVVGWRVEYLKGAARHNSGSSCETYFRQDEWIAIVMFITRKRPDPHTPPPTGEFLKMIAQLGGYINKKSQGPPGSITIWRGMSQFETITQAYRVFNPDTCGV